MLLDPAFDDYLGQLTLYSRLAWFMAWAALALLLIFALGWHRRSESPQKVSLFRDPIHLLKRLHRSDSATASLEYLMVLLPFLIIVMTFWQFALMFNAQLYVGYSAYAAARSAAVQIPAEYNDEAEGILKPQKSSGAEKWRRIRRAAVPGTLPISPGDMTDAAGVWAAARVKKFIKGGPEMPSPSADAKATGARMSLMTAHSGVLTGKRYQRAAVKSTYAENMTVVFINDVDHRGKDPKGKTKSSGPLNLSSTDVVSVTVKYVFYLNVPFVGRMLELAFAGIPDNVITQQIVNPYPSMVLSETVSMKTWRKLRATNPC